MQERESYPWHPIPSRASNASGQLPELRDNSDFPQPTCGKTMYISEVKKGQTGLAPEDRKGQDLDISVNSRLEEFGQDSDSQSCTQVW